MGDCDPEILPDTVYARAPLARKIEHYLTALNGTNCPQLSAPFDHDFRMHQPDYRRRPPVHSGRNPTRQNETSLHHDPSRRRRRAHRRRLRYRSSADLARLYRAGELIAIRIPSETDERVRDVVRCRETFQREILKSRHCILKFLATRWFVFREGTNWCTPHLTPSSRQLFAESQLGSNARASACTATLKSSSFGTYRA